MQFTHTEDRRALQDSIDRLLADQLPIETRNEHAYSAPYVNASLLTALCELGLPYAFASEENGGFGGAGFDITAVFEIIGKHLCAEPLTPMLFAAKLLQSADRDLEPLLAGETRYGVAYGEVAAPWDLDQISCAATQQGNGLVLNGAKSCVYGGQITDQFLVAAKLNGATALLQVAATDCAIQSYGLIDGGGAADLRFADAPATLLMADAAGAFGDALDFAALSVCAEAIGAMGTAFDLMIDYLQTRKQFGTALGKFQALQHRAVDLLSEIEQSRSIVIHAASRMGQDDQSQAVHMAKALIGRTARKLCEESLQMQGGIAMTWEYASSHYAKRLAMLDHQFGDENHHLSRIVDSYAA